MRSSYPCGGSAKAFHCSITFLNPEAQLAPNFDGGKPPFPDPELYRPWGNGVSVGDFFFRDQVSIPQFS
jgi:hypothetical protein